MELATDLVSLALYDIVIFADDSGSMIFEEGGDRVDDLKLIVGRVAEVWQDSKLSGKCCMACHLCRSRTEGGHRRSCGQGAHMPSGTCDASWSST